MQFPAREAADTQKWGLPFAVRGAITASNQDLVSL